MSVKFDLTGDCDNPIANEMAFAEKWKISVGKDRKIIKIASVTGTNNNYDAYLEIRLTDGTEIVFNYDDDITPWGGEATITIVDVVWGKEIYDRFFDILPEGSGTTIEAIMKIYVEECYSLKKVSVTTTKTVLTKNN
jgi:hypothetical protein